MIILGVVLLVVGLLVHLHVLFVIGCIIALIGLILLALGSTNRSVGGRRYWF